MPQPPENDAVQALVGLPDSDYLFHNGEWWVRSIAAREAVQEAAVSGTVSDAPIPPVATFGATFGHPATGHVHTDGMACRECRDIPSGVSQ